MKIIIDNRKSRFDYALEKPLEAGLSLEGWEVKSLRAGKCQLVDSYVRFFEGEAYLIGALITPLASTDTLKQPDPRRDRKLLMKRRELDKLRGQVEQKGMTLVCTGLYWKDGRVKASVALAKGKQLHDKRQSEKERSVQRDLARYR